MRGSSSDPSNPAACRPLGPFSPSLLPFLPFPSLPFLSSLCLPLPTSLFRFTHLGPFDVLWIVR